MKIIKFYNLLPENFLDRKVNEKELKLLNKFTNNMKK